jgi:hypothetical protein
MSFRNAHPSQAGSLATESPLHDLTAIIRSRTPLIAVESNEEPQVVSTLRQLGRQLQLKTFRWTVTEGMVAFDTNDQPTQSVLRAQELLTYIKTSAANCLFVLLDFRRYLEDDVHIRFLKDIALDYSRHKIHLLKRALDPRQFDLAMLAQASEGFSGSEIEQAIVSSMYTAHAAGRGDFATGSAGRTQADSPAFGFDGGESGGDTRVGRPTGRCRAIRGRLAWSSRWVFLQSRVEFLPTANVKSLPRHWSSHCL